MYACLYIQLGRTHGKAKHYKYPRYQSLSLIGKWQNWCFLPFAPPNWGCGLPCWNLMNRVCHTSQSEYPRTTGQLNRVDRSSGYPPYGCHWKQGTELEPKTHLSRCDDVLTHLSRHKNSGRRTKTRKKVLTRRKASTRIVLQPIRSQQQPKLGIRLFYRGGGWVMSAACLCFQWQNNTKEAKKRKMTDNQQWQKIDNMIKKGKATWTWICLFSMSFCLGENKTAQTSQQHPTFSYEKTKNKHRATLVLFESIDDFDSEVSSMESMEQQASKRMGKTSHLATPAFF